MGNVKGFGRNRTGKLTSFINSVWLNETLPSDWKQRIIVQIPKKGIFSKCSNWRGITLLYVPGKVLSYIIYARLKDEAQDAMREEQDGFRKDRGCSDHLFAL